MFAAAGMLLATSCQNDELDSVMANGDESTVSFTIALDGEVSARTRAISDGLTVNNLYWEVYDSEGNEVETLKGDKSNAFSGGKAEVKFDLAKGQTYTFAFWAQKDDAYNTDDLTNVVLDCAGTVAGNDENRDAFYSYTEPITIGDGANSEHNVTLKRPFAQLNLAVSDLVAFEAAGITLDKVGVTVTEVANSFNVLTGKVGDEVADMTFALADVICGKPEAETLTLTSGIGITDASGAEVLNFPWLSMNYLLVNDDSENGAKSANVDVTFTIKTSHDDVVLKSTGTPVQRNFRTNLIAKLTSEETMKIVIDPIYNGETDINDGDKTVYNVRGGKNLYKTLADAISAGETDLVLGDGEHTLDKQNLNADLKITGTSPAAKLTWKAGSGNDMRWNSVTLENVTVVSPAKGDMPMGGPVSENAPFILKNCVIENVYFCLSKDYQFNGCTFNIENSNVYNVWTYGADVDFENCVFKSAGKSVLIYSHSYNGWKTVNLKDCEFYASTPVDKKAAIEIDSEICPFNVNIEDCTATGFSKGGVSGNSLYNLKNGKLGENCNITVSYADGGVAYNCSNKKYTVSTAEGMIWFANEINVNGYTISDETLELADDIDLQNIQWTPVKIDGYNGAQIIEIDGNGHTIKGLTAPLLAGGFAGSSGVSICNLTIANSTLVSTNTQGSGAFVECSDSQELVELTNCHLKDSKLRGSRTGGLVGWTSGYDNTADGAVRLYVKIKNCSVVNCTIDGGSESAGGIIGHSGANAWTFTTISDCVVRDCIIKGGSDKTGVVVGTVNVGMVNTIDNVTMENNIVNGVDSKEVYGRFVPGSTGKLVIDGQEVK